MSKQGILSGWKIVNSAIHLWKQVSATFLNGFMFTESIVQENNEELDHCYVFIWDFSQLE